jgi:NAD(P)-dependent dehydrogenase (short-subunit alcohol dehydrogenase family)
VDSVETSSYKTLDINVSHAVRATQLAIDYFLRQKLGHGVVVIVTSVAAQTGVLAAPLYTLSKHAMSGFTRSLADLEPRLNIRVSAIAPGSVKTPIWSGKLNWINEEVDSWVPAERLAEVMLSLVTDANNVGGTILECGTDTIRRVEILNDPGPRGRGFSVANFSDGVESTYASIKETFGK